MKFKQIVSHHQCLFALDENGQIWVGRFDHDTDSKALTDASKMTWTLVPFRG